MERGEETVTDFGIVALTFDVGGTLIDWHGTIRQELALLGEKRGFERDWGEVTNSWTWSAIRAVQKQKPPAVVNLDAFYRATLDDTLVKFGLVGVTDAEKSTLATAWHKLAAWPDAPAGHARLREKFIVAALTIQTLSLIIDVSRQAPFHWDCIIACEMLGCYKPDPLAYQRAAELLVLRPRSDTHGRLTQWRPPRRPGRRVPHRVHPTSVGAGGCINTGSGAKSECGGRSVHRNRSERPSRPSKSVGRMTAGGPDEIGLKRH